MVPTWEGVCFDMISRVSFEDRVLKRSKLLEGIGLWFREVRGPWLHRCRGLRYGCYGEWLALTGTIDHRYLLSMRLSIGDTSLLATSLLATYLLATYLLATSFLPDWLSPPLAAISLRPLAMAVSSPSDPGIQVSGIHPIIQTEPYTTSQKAPIRGGYEQAPPRVSSTNLLLV